MKVTLKQFLTLIQKSLLSFFGVGFIPVAPGTFGSVAAIPCIIFYKSFGLSLIFEISLIISLTILAIYSAQKIQLKFNLKDPQWIVIDEVIGMMISSLLIKEISISSFLIVLILFRFFDIIKIWPASYFDKLSHGAGTILDDVISGIYSLIIFYLILIFFPKLI